MHEKNHWVTHVLSTHVRAFLTSCPLLHPHHTHLGFVNSGTHYGGWFHVCIIDQQYTRASQAYTGLLEKSLPCMLVTTQRPELRIWRRDESNPFHFSHSQLELAVRYPGGIYKPGRWGGLSHRHRVVCHQHSPIW